MHLREVAPRTLEDAEILQESDSDEPQVDGACDLHPCIMEKPGAGSY